MHIPLHMRKFCLCAYILYIHIYCICTSTIYVHIRKLYIYRRHAHIWKMCIYKSRCIFTKVAHIWEMHIYIIYVQLQPLYMHNLCILAIFVLCTTFVYAHICLRIYGIYTHIQKLHLCRGWCSTQLRYMHIWITYLKF